jgi:hypothetical protein
MLNAPATGALDGTGSFDAAAFDQSGINAA